MNTPWGTSQSVDKIAYGVVWCSTAGHGGLGISRVQARKLLSDAALLCANYHNGYYWFEEDCQCTIAFLEHPEWAARFNGTADSYKASVERHYPRYYEYLTTNKKAPREPVVGQSLKVRGSFGGLLVDEILKVVEVRAASVIVTRPSHTSLMRIQMSWILGTGCTSLKYLEVVE